MPLPLDFKWASGKSALMGSLAYFLTEQITDEFFDFDNPLLPVQLPGYGVTEKGLYNIAPIAFEHFMGYKMGYSGWSGISGVSGWSGLQPVYGKKNQTLIEISAWDDETKNKDAVNKVRQMRDKVIYAIYNAGRRNDSGSLVLPPITLYNFNVSPKEEIGIIELDQNDNSINEKFMVDPINSNIKIYRLLIRLFWYEYL